MSWDLFKLIVDRDMVAGDVVGIHVLGETLLHPKAIDMIKYMKKKDLSVELATNGTVLDEDMSKKLIKSGLDSLWLSFDGATKETYEKIRVGAKFFEVMSNMGTFLDLNAQSKNPIKVTIQMVGQPDNKEEGELFHQLWETYKSPWVQVKVKFLDTWAGTFFEELITQPEFPRYACAEPFNRVAVLANGDVVPCCRDWEGKLVYGNLGVSSLQEIWLSSVNLLNLRSEMLKGDWEKLPEPCLSCKEWYIPMDRNVGTTEEIELELKKREF
jgi:radical SAM protein with 4Fe4S-binding SPASM domain